MALLLVVAGALLLALAGNALVDFAAALARRARVSPAVIGLTVVAAGTSMPELFVSLTAAWHGSSEIALGNVVGSNIANVGLILGAASLIGTLPFDLRVLRLEYPLLIIASAVTILLGRDGVFDRLEGGFFLGAAAAFVSYSVWVARREITRRERERIADGVPEPSALSQRPLAFLVAGLTLALGGLTIGAHWLVEGAVVLAGALGVSQRVIGLTLVAVGTSLPELVASIAATVKGHRDIAVTNVLGSNIFNLLLILGGTALLRPVPVDSRVTSFDLWVMLAFAVVPAPLVVRSRALSRRDGALLLLLYCGYVALVVK